MLKFPAIPSKNKDMSYSNSCISEYLGCQIYDSVGVSVQKTLLGTYTQQNGKTKIVVACKDLETDGFDLKNFASLKNTVIDSEHNGYGTELQDILDSIRADKKAWENYQTFSDPYKRIRVAYIDAARKRPEEFQKRLANFIEKTRDGKLIVGYGGIEKYYK